MSYTPTLIIVFGTKLAEELCHKAEALIKERFNSRVCPPIFQFLPVDNNTWNSQACSQLYLKLHSQENHQKFKETYGFEIKSKVDIFFISPFQQRDFDNCLDAVNLIRNISARFGNECSLNAIFILAQQLLEIEEQQITETALILDQKMSTHEPPFNRCYFIDEINENKNTLTRFQELTELLAIFLDLVVATPMNALVDKHFPPYSSYKSPKDAYASFSCNVFEISPEKLNVFFSEELARKTWHDLNALNAQYQQTAYTNSQPNRLLEWQEWFIKGENLNQTSYLTIEELENDKDFIQAWEKIVTILVQELKDRLYDFSGFRYFLNDSLERWLIRLEKYSSDTKNTKKDIAEQIIRNLFPLAPPQQVPIPVTITRKRETFGVRFKLLLRRIFKRKSKNQLVASKPLDNSSSPTNEESEKSTAVSISDQLTNHETCLKKINVLTALFIYLDKICINLDLLNERFSPEKYEELSASESIFQIDLLNSVMLNALFLEEIKNLDSRITFGNLSENGVDDFINELGKYLDGEAKKKWIDLCAQKIQFTHKQIDILRKANKIYPHLTFDVLKPFWNPIGKLPDEGFTAVLWGNRGENCNHDLFGSNSLNNELLVVESEKCDSISFLQISLGLELDKIIENISKGNQNNDS